jgi:hypothetical protein
MIAFNDERTVNFAMPEKIRAACCVCMLEDGIKNIFRREEIIRACCNTGIFCGLCQEKVGFVQHQKFGMMVQQ